MSRLIDADLLKENINNWYALVNEYGQTRMTLSHNDILAKIDNAPTVCDIDDDKFKQKAGIVISQLRADRDRLEKVIEDIRAEIEQERDKVYQNRRGHDTYYADGLDTALEIIDKHTKGE